MRYTTGSQVRLYIVALLAIALATSACGCVIAVKNISATTGDTLDSFSFDGCADARSARREL